MIAEAFFKGAIPFLKVLWKGKSVVCRACGYNARIMHFATCPKCGTHVD